MDCLFCKLISGELPADFVYQDDACVAFRDIAPQAPFHVLVVPRKHVAGLHESQPDDDLQSLLLAAAEIARRAGLMPDGYRVVINSGPGAGQTVFHLHLHLLGGRPLSWPPG
jgi:histidine triad (HIT) family protein